MEEINHLLTKNTFLETGEEDSALTRVTSFNREKKTQKQAIRIFPKLPNLLFFSALFELGFLWIVGIIAFPVLQSKKLKIR